MRSVTLRNGDENTCSKGGSLRVFFLPFILLFLAVSSSAAGEGGQSQLLAGDIENLLRSDIGTIIAVDGELLRESSDLYRFYEERNFAPVWFDESGPLARTEILLELLRSSPEEGLCSEDYHLPRIEEFFRQLPEGRPAYVLEILLTDGFLHYARELSGGMVDPATIHEVWRRRRRKIDPVRFLQEALEGDRLAEAAAGLVPHHESYALLRRKLHEYLEIRAQGGWPTLPGGPLLYPGKRDNRLPLIRERLGMEPVEEAEIQHYDQEVVGALRRFQSRHGLQVDGVLGPKTLAELNVPARERVRQIELNLERRRWLPKSLGERYIQVNVAAFELELIEGDRTAIIMPVIVGTALRKTPVFSGRMTYLEFAPYWSVPPTILREDKLPVIRYDPGWVKRHHYEIIPWRKGSKEPIDPFKVNWRRVRPWNFPGQLRMRPGPWNPLGRVKFMFPNPYSIYLHDTPDRHLFARNVRTFSSGCIRVERPLDLAQYLLEEDGFACDEMVELMSDNIPARVSLSSSIPVHLFYWTAWVDKEGELQFRKDIYLRDLDLETALTKEQMRETGTQEAEGGSQVTESGSQVMEAGSQVMEAGSREAESGSQVMEAGSREAEGGSLETETGSQETETGSQVTETGNLEAETGSQETEVGSGGTGS